VSPVLPCHIVVGTLNLTCVQACPCSALCGFRPPYHYLKASVLQQVGIIVSGATTIEAESIPVPVVRVVIDGVISHQATWSHPLKHLSNRTYTSWSRGPAIKLPPNGYYPYLHNMRPSFVTLLKGCERLPVRAVWAVGTTSGSAGTLHGQVLCMLVFYGKRIQLGVEPCFIHIRAHPTTPGVDDVGKLPSSNPEGPTGSNTAQPGPQREDVTHLPVGPLPLTGGTTPGSCVAGGPEQSLAGTVVVPPVGDECQLPGDFAESYGITSTQVLTTSEAPAWWVQACCECRKHLP
jgi:hypothetical protein